MGTENELDKLVRELRKKPTHWDYILWFVLVPIAFTVLVLMWKMWEAGGSPGHD